MTPEDLLYNKSHEWVSLETDDAGDKIATIGISSFALELLTDLVYVELPENGRTVVVGEPFGVVESVKAVSDLNSPVEGEIVDVNFATADDLEILMGSPYGNGWLVKVKLSSESGLDELLDYDAYRSQCKEEQG